MAGDENPSEPLPARPPAGASEAGPHDVVGRSLAHPPLRLTRLGNGYRIGDVEFVLAGLQLVVRELERDASEHLRRLADSEAEVERLRAAADGVRRRESELAALEASAVERVRRVISDAELDADRIRGDARLRIDETAADFDELLRLRDGLLRSLRALVQEFEEAIERVARGESVAAAPRRGPVLGVVELDSDPGPRGQLSGTDVELNAGPFSDFASLSGFEQALSKLPHVSDVFVRHFASERAMIEVTLREPASLEDELRRFLPYPVDVRRADDGTLEVDLAAHGSRSADRR